LVAIALAVSACNSNNFLYVNPIGETKEIVESSIPDVNKALGCAAWSLMNDTIKISEKESLGRREVRMFRDTEKLREFDEKAWGVFSVFENVIYLIGDENESFKLTYFKEGLRFIALHELGHAMGLEHEEGTVMNENYHFMPYPQALESLVFLINKHGKNPCPLLMDNHTME
jgi:hypothetical protein